MPENVFGFGSIFRFLEQLFNTGHIPPFFGLFRTIAKQQGSVIELIQPVVMEDGTVPGLPELRCGTGIRTEEMEQRFIHARTNAQAADDGRDAEVIGTCHKPYNNNDEPAISSGSGKAGFEVGKSFLNKF